MSAAGGTRTSGSGLAGLCRGALGLLLLLGLLQVGLRVWRKARPGPMPGWLEPVLASAPRRWALRLERLVQQMGARPGWNVVEVGPGPGLMTPLVARAVGPEGRVIAVDLRPLAAERTRRRLERTGAANVQTLAGDARALPIPRGWADLVCLVAVLGEVPDRVRALREAYHALRPGGRLSVTEMLPDPDYLLPATVYLAARAAGFDLEERVGGRWLYTMTFRKPPLPPEPVT